MVCISDKEVGIDIEKIKGVKPDIVGRFFTIDEIEYIFLANEDVDRRFYEIWTKKEAYIKWSGKGLSMPLVSFSVFNKDIADKMKIYEINGYMISVFIENADILDGIMILHEKVLLNYALLLSMPK